MNNIVQILKQRCDEDPGSVAIIDGPTRYSVGQLYQMVSHYAREYALSGIGPGHIVLQQFQYETNLLVSILACAQVGAVAHSLPTFASEREILDAAGRLKPRFYASDGIRIEKPKLVHLAIDAVGKTEFAPGSFNRHIFTNDCLWLLATGSGSSGAPKLIPVRHSQQIRRMKLARQWLPLDPGDAICSLISSEFYAAKQRFLEALCNGLTYNIQPKETLVDRIKEGSVQGVYGTPNQVAKLAEDYTNRFGEPAKNIKAVLIGGATVSMELRNSLRDVFGDTLYILYGSNETHTSCITDMDTVYDIEGIVGRPFDGVEIQVVNNDGEVLEPGNVGEVRIKHPCVVDGYFEPQKTGRPNFQDGWFYPRDRGEITPDGQLIHHGRSDAMMILNGINIHPSEIQAALHNHEAVRDSVVLSAAHPIHGDIPVSAVELTKGKAVDEAELLQFAKTWLGAKSPKRVVVFQEFPRTRQGKLNRETLSRMIYETLYPRDPDSQSPSTERPDEA